MDTRAQLLFAACLLPTLIVLTAGVVSLVTPEGAPAGIASAPEYLVSAELP